jgi:TPR repeat protein
MKRRRNIAVAGLLLSIVLIGLSIPIVRAHLFDSALLAIEEDRGVDAIPKLKLLASFGDRASQMLLADIFAYGRGNIPKNDPEAIYWIKRYVVIGSGLDISTEELRIGKTYLDGSEGIKADFGIALIWLRRSERDGSRQAAELIKKMTLASPVIFKNPDPTTKSQTQNPSKK